MKKLHSSLLCALCAFAFLVSPKTVHADPVDYFAGFGSFETSDPDASLDFNGTNVSNSIPGWRVFISGSRFTPFPEWQNNGQAQDAERHLLLRARGGSDPGSTGASFDFSISPVALTPGELYELTFWAAGGLNTMFPVNFLGVGVTNSTRIDFDDPYQIPVAQQIDTLDWQKYSMTFIPASSDVRLVLGSPIGSWSSVYLDNFSLRLIPEPGSMLLLGTAAGFLGLRRRRPSRERAPREMP